MKRQQKNIVGTILSICFALLYACDANTLDNGIDCPNNLDDVFVCGTFPPELQGDWGNFESRGSVWPTTKNFTSKIMETDSTGIYLRNNSITDSFPAYGAYVNAGTDSANRTLGNILTDRPSADVVTDKVKVANITLGDQTGTLKIGLIPSSDVRYGITGDKNNLKVMILSGYVDTYNNSRDYVETISVGGAYWEFTLVGESSAAYHYNVRLGANTTAPAYIGENYQIVKWK